MEGKFKALFSHDTSVTNLYAPNFEKVGEHIGFGLCVRSRYRPETSCMDSARKIVDPYFPE